MKILLTAVNAKFIHTNPAVRSLQAYADAAGWSSCIAEYTINQSRDLILADLYRQKPDVIAFSCYIWNRQMIFSLLEDLPKILPETEIWLGGPEVSYDAPDILRAHPRIRGIMTGEGEAVFRDLCRHWYTGEPALPDIPGCCIRVDGEPAYTGLRDPVPMDDIPFFYSNMTEFRDRIPYYESSRGCPFRCTYCLSSIDKHIRFRSLDLVLPELQFFLDQKVPQVKFIDRTFNCDRKRSLTIWRYLAEHDNGFTNFHFEIAADLLDEEALALLNTLRPGLIQLEIGVQTTHPETVTAIRRKMDLDVLERVVHRLRIPGNIHLHLDLIAGLPEEDLPTFRQSFDRVFAMKPHDLQLGFLKVLKGSPMEELAPEYDLKYRSEPPYEVLSTRWLSYGDLLELKGVEEMLELYHNSGQYTCILPLLIRESGSAYDFFLQLSRWYREHGFEVCQPSRMQRYLILLDFACSRHPEKRDLYAECLTYDAYLREKCKRRPEFSPDLIPCKALIASAGARPEDHTDVFRYTVWEEEPAPAASPVPVIFRYDRRDAIYRNAETERVVPGSQTPVKERTE